MGSPVAVTVACLRLVGAARLWEERAEVVRRGVEQVEALVEQTLAEAGGEPCATGRAGRMVRFEQPEDAVLWACRLQGELLEVDWPDALLEHSEAAEVRGEGGDVLYRGLRVSVGVDTGLANRRRDGWTGRLEYDGEVFDSARELAERAEGGRVAVSPELFHAFGANRWTELGVEAVERGGRREGGESSYFSAYPAELAARRQQPAASRLAATSNLPRYETSFVGRTSQMAALAGLTDATPSWVSLVGTPGVGKTRLAVEFARRWAREAAHAPREAWFCDLTETPQLENALHAIARVLGVQLPPEEGAAQVAERLGNALSGRGAVLLVLDNAEHLIDELAAVLADWLEASDALVLLATSRRRASHQRETVLEVEALAREPARMLLEHRLIAPRGIQVRFGQRDRAALREIVDRCGELPLAIELVASSGRRLSPRQLLRAWREDDRHGPMERLDQAIERTWGLLDPWERDALKQCAVFAGGFALEAADAVVDLSGHPDAPATSDVLEALYAHSLLRSAPGRESSEETRFAMYEPVRVFAASRQDEEVGAQARARQAAHFVEWAERAAAALRGVDELRWIDRLMEELPNLIAAYDFGREHQPLLAVRLMIALRELDTRIGPLGGQKERAETVVQLAEQLDDPVMLAEARLVRAQTRIWSHQFEGAEADYRAALDLAEGRDEPAEIRALLGCAFALSHRGQYQQGSRWADRARELTRQSGTVDEINALGWSGVIYAELDRDTRGVPFLNEGLVLARQLQNPSSLARVLSALGSVIGSTRPDEGRRYLDEALELFRAQGNRRQITFTLFELARMATAEGDHAGGERYFEEALELCASIGESEYEALVLQGRARSRFMRGMYADAEDDLIRALANVRDETYLHLNVGICSYLGACYAALDRLAEAETFFERAERALADTDVHSLPVILEVLRGFAAATRSRHALAAGRDDEAAAQLQRAYACCAYPNRDDVVEVGAAREVAGLLRAHLDEQVEAGLVPAHAAPARRVLEIGAEARWFCLDDAERVDISRRGALRKILAALVDHRLDAPGEPMTVDQVIAAGWPDEVLTPTSGARRVYSTINRMRDLGLEEVLQTVDDGYMLDPDVMPVRR